MKKGIIVLGSLIMLSLGVTAADTDTLTIVGTVPEIAAVQITDSQVNLSQLGNQAYSNEKVGEVTLDSNDADGFTISYSSDMGGYLTAGGTSTSEEDSRISYTVSLSNPTGTLGDNITVGTLTEQSPVDGSVTFAGASASPTYQRTYDIGISTAIKGLNTGSYSDVLTITIANI